MLQILRVSVVVLVFLSLHGSVRSSQGGLDSPPGIRKETGDVREEGENKAGDPVTDHELERRRRAAEDLWIELTEGEGKAKNHEHWERIVRRSARGWYDPFYRDDTAHIVDVQDYYRHVLDNDWEVTNIQETYLNRGQAQELNAKAYSRMEIFKPIPGRYIVMLQTYSDDYILDRTIAILQQAHTESEGRIRVEHITPMKSIGSGFTATMNSKAVELLRKNPFLDILEEDIALKRATIQESDNQEAEDQHHSSRIPWNLDRLDQHGPKLDNHFNPEGDGHLASIYVIDTGVNYDHEQFEGRAHYSGFDAVDKLTGSNREGRDCEGHGTHCAGTAAGKTYGVARKATIYSVRALGCNGAGAVSGIVEGMNFIAKKKATTHSGPVIFSMSLGVRASHSLNAAVKRAMIQGIAAVGAAGNQGDDSCKYSPASARDGIAVGATDQSDKMVAFSNAGACTDVYAPGTEIKSATSSCNTCTKTLSGTSMAAPHVAGYMAIILSLNPKMTAIQAKQMMIQQSTKDAVDLAVISSSLASRTPNRLLYVPQTSTQSFGKYSTINSKAPKYIWFP